jgi:hypothetical protein
MQNERLAMRLRSKKQPAGKHTAMTRAALELAIAEAVRIARPECSALMGVIVERQAPATPGGANWAVKGLKFGKADREQCRAVLSKLMRDEQFDCEISD